MESAKHLGDKWRPIDDNEGKIVVMKKNLIAYLISILCTAREGD